MPNKIIEDSYLGDGVYASFDGYNIVLDLRARDSTTKIALEPAVFGALLNFKTALDVACRALPEPGTNEKGT